VEEIQNIKYSWLILFEEAKQVASNLGTGPELRRGSKIRKKNRFFDDTDADCSFTFEFPVIGFKIRVFFQTKDLLL
jgi:hypothetical protein